MRVHLVIEECQSGSFADGSTYVVLSAHPTEAGAESAVDAWRESHGEPAHAFDPGLEDEDDWCQRCEAGVVIDSAEVAE